MMRHTVQLILIAFVIAASFRVASAQEISFRARDVMHLAKVIASEARRTNQLPSAYLMQMDNGAKMVVTAPNAFELLVRAVIDWKNNGSFPGAVPLLIGDLAGPAADPQLEPKRDGQVLAMPTVDIGTNAPYWLAMAEAPGHKMPKAMKFETEYRLTAAQITISMALLIDETLRENKFPSAIAIPLVRSPRNWNDTRNPVSAIIVEPPAPPPEPKADIRVFLNGTELTFGSSSLPGLGGMPPFCGYLRIELQGAGPISSIRVLQDGVEFQVFQGLGPHRFAINTLTLTDGLHTMAAMATDTKGRTHATIFSFSVMNGRAAGFSPAERHEQEIEATPAPTATK